MISTCSRMMHTATSKTPLLRQLRSPTPKMTGLIKRTLAIAITTTTVIAGVCIAKRLHDSLSTEIFLHGLHQKVKQTIEHTTAIPGLQVAELGALRKEVLSLWQTLSKTGSIQIKGKDQDIRPVFVTLQAVCEHMLSQGLRDGTIHSLQACIHTPLPPTPLCTKGEISPGLVSPAIAADPQRLFTVQARSEVVREFLQGGATLTCVYPKEGLYKRSLQQREIYQQEIEKNPHTLLDHPLPCHALPANLIGATYLFKDKLGQTFVFAIDMPQATEPAETGSFALYFGSIQTPVIEKRYECLVSLLRAYHIPFGTPTSDAPSILGAIGDWFSPV